MEAALVLPVVILITITSILIIMFFYSQMSERCRLHIALRKEAGTVTEKTIYMGDIGKVNTDADIYKKREIGGMRIYGDKNLVMGHKGLLNKKGKFTIEGRCHTIDGPAYVRYVSLLAGDQNEE